MTETASKQGLGIDAAVDRVRPEVSRRLREVEAGRNLRIVFACESGSRAWGFASSDSDFDVRFIFVRPTEDYLSLTPPKDAFDLHQDQDFDLAGWDIRKTAELMRRCNPPLMEWLDSPIIYEADAVISHRLVEMREVYFDPKKAAHHYLSLAAGIWKKYIQNEPSPVRKKYLYALRPLACIKYIEVHGKQPPTLFDAVLDGIDWSDEVRAAIVTLVEQKRSAGELGSQPADPVLAAHITAALEESEQIAEALPINETPTQALNKLINLAVLGE
ncbi:MAG: nucleotidyltransferase domain-containing protein [Planctomycetota bacterium]